MDKRRQRELRQSTAIRVGVAVLLAAALSALAIVASWGPFETRTAVVGNPAFDAFNTHNYVNAYYIAVLAFPLGALLLFLGLTWVGPRLGLATPPRRGPIRPAVASPDPGSPLAADPPIEASGAKRLWIEAGRIGFVAALIGLEAGIAADSIALGMLLIAPLYALAVLGLAALIRRGRRRDWPLEARLACVNSLGAPLAVGGLIAVSSITAVRVIEDGSIVHYPWFPAWVGLPAAFAVAGVVAVALHRAAVPGRAIEVERTSLLLVAAPVCLFVLTASLLIDAPSVYGDSPTGDLFHSGEQLVASRLVADGWFPWRDVVVSHGLLLDVAGPLAGQGIFGASRWGNAAGATMLLHPLYLVAVYFLCVYLFGRNWLFLLLTGLIFVGTLLGPEIPEYGGGSFRFFLWPLVLLVLAAALNRPSLLRSAGLAVLVFATAILTPELAPTAIAVFLVLVLYEWYWHRPGTRIAAAFSRSICFAATGAVLAGLFAGFLAAHGALDDFFYVSTTLVEGHLLKGGIPPATYLAPSEELFYFAALAPPVSVLALFGYSFARLRLRQELRTADWVMVAVAISLLLYYPKFLARMDFVHLTQPYSLALPLILYVVYRAVEAADRAIRLRAPGSLSVRITAHPVSLVVVALVATLASHELGSRVTSAAATFRPVAVERPALARLGYQSDFDLVAYRDLKRVVDAYLGPRDRLFDFTNEPVMFLHLIDRDPSTRWITTALTQTPEIEADQVRRLMRARPKLIVFDATSNGGLSSWDGISNMVHAQRVSSWILDRYRPLLATHSHTIYARRDQPAPAQVGLRLQEKPVIRGVEFQSQICDWGKTPSFLSQEVLPDPQAAGTGVPTRRLSATTLRVEPPAGSRWGDFRWLALDSADGFGDSEIILGDRLRSPSPGRLIGFETLESSPRPYVVPVANCAQWRGYRGPLLLRSDPPQDISAVRVIR